jgi:hypothetical protein
LLNSDFEVSSFVRTSAFVFAILSALDGKNSLFRIRVDSGVGEDLLVNIGERAELLLGDHVYLFDPDSHELRSMLLDGSAPKVEEGLAEPQSVGAYPGGSYYIGYLTAGDGNGRRPLYYRPQADAPWQELKADVEGSFESSSVYGVVYSEPIATDETTELEARRLYLLQEERLIPFGVAPLNMARALATEEGITALTFDLDTSVPALWWLTLDSPPVHYELPAQADRPSMCPYREGVALSLVEGKSAYVQTFGPGGAQPGKIGVRRGSVLLGLDDHHLWHMVVDFYLIKLRFLSTQLDPFAL